MSLKGVAEAANAGRAAIKSEEAAAKAAEKAYKKGDILAPVTSGGKLSEPGNNYSRLTTKTVISEDEALAKYSKATETTRAPSTSSIKEQSASPGTSTVIQKSETPEIKKKDENLTYTDKERETLAKQGQSKEYSDYYNNKSEIPELPKTNAAKSIAKEVGVMGLTGAGLFGAGYALNNIDFSSLIPNPDQGDPDGGRGGGGNPFTEWLLSIFGAGDGGKKTSDGDPTQTTTQTETDGQLDEWLKRFLDGGYIYNPDKGYLYDPATGEVAYIGSGGDPGESGTVGISSVFGDAAELLKNNLPLIIGIVVIIAIIVFASKGSSKKPKSKKGGSRA